MKLTTVPKSTTKTGNKSLKNLPFYTKIKFKNSNASNSQRIVLFEKFF